MSRKEQKITPVKAAEYSLLLLVALALIYFSFRGVNWSEFLSELSGCRWEWIILSMIIGGLEFYIRALRWKLLLNHRGGSLKTINAYRGITIGNLSNFALPRIGEIVRCSVVASSEKVPFEGAVGTVVAERACDLLCLLFLMVAMILSNNRFSLFLKDNVFSNTLASKIIILCLAVGIVAILLLIIFYMVKKRTNKSSGNKYTQKIGSIIARFKEGLLSIFRLKGKLLFIFLTIALWSCFLLTSKLTIMAFPALGSLTWSDALFLMIVGGLGWAVPVQGGIGAYHFIVSLALMQLYSISQSESLAFATISHTSQAVVMIILGVISMVFYTIAKRKILKST